MSAIYVERHGVAVVIAALLLGACSSSGPRVEEPRTESVASESQAVPSSAATEESRGRRGRAARRSAEALEANLEPISERVARSYERALVAMQNGSLGEAELELEQLILEEPGFPGPYVNLAIIYAEDGRIDDALVVIDAALAIDEGFPAANNQLGRLLREQGRFDDAEAAYRRALETDPDYAPAHYNLGILLDLYLRRPAEALEHYALYQATLAEPDETVARWIVDLERRSGLSAERVARDQQ